MDVKREEDFLDEMSQTIAAGDGGERDEWEAAKLVAHIAKARKALGLTQAQVAERMGVAQQYVARLENRPWGAGFGRVIAYARAVGVEVGIVGHSAEAA